MARPGCETDAEAGSTREHILDAAVTVLRDQGHERLTQVRVALAAGVTQGHLTYYFPHKSDLWIAVARRSVERLGAELVEDFAGRGPAGADATTRERIAGLVGFIVKDRARSRLLLHLVLQSHVDPAIGELLRHNLAELRALTRAGMGARGSDANVDLQLASLWGLAVRHLLDDSEHADTTTDNLLAHLLASRAAQEPTT